MKYIRTKDGIYKVWNWWNNSGTVPEQNIKTISCYVGNGKDIPIEEIFKQSNTIEELIDAYILKDTKTGYCGVMSKETMKHSINPGTAYGREFYGAIWVIDENGMPTLAPVAKMNENGELCLL